MMDRLASHGRPLFGRVQPLVVSAIGSEDSAHPRFTDVLSAMSDPSERKKAETAVTRVLKLLTDDAGLIDPEVPAWAAPSSKLRRYRINDPYLRFWFRYAERQVDRIARGRSDLAIAHFDRDWSSWRGRSVEPIVRDAVQRLATSIPQLAEVESVRPWWVRDGQVEIDVVAGSATETVLLGTIKWRTSGGVTPRELAQLRAQRELVPHAAAASLAVISPEGAPPPGADLALTAADLLQAWG